MDTTNIFSAILQDEAAGINRDRQRASLTTTLDKWSRRMVFGTDYPVGMSDLKTIHTDFFSFDLRKDIRENLQYKTARDILDRYARPDHIR